MVLTIEYLTNILQIYILGRYKQFLSSQAPSNRLIIFTNLLKMER